MSEIRKSIRWVLLCGAAATGAVGGARAQTPPASAPPPTPQAEAGEPRANTSPSTPKPTPQAEAGEPRANTSPGATPQAEAGEPRANTVPSAPRDSTTNASRPAAGVAAGAGAAAGPGASVGAGSGAAAGAGTAAGSGAAAGQGGSMAKAGGATVRSAPRTATGRVPGAADKVDLSTATVTGDREQPKVMYIVPWKRADIGDLSGKPTNSLLDEALSPVDREEFKREVVYYGAVKADADQKGEK